LLNNQASITNQGRAPSLQSEADDALEVAGIEVDLFFLSTAYRPEERPSEVTDGSAGGKEGGVPPRVFISHSSEDAALAEVFADLLREALGLKPREIRCTSVDGYRLHAGARTSDTIRREVMGSTVFIALITPSSLRSGWVMIELGGRWASQRLLIPVLAKGTLPKNLRDPLKDVNAIAATELGQLHQLLENIGEKLDLPLLPASALGPSLERVVAASTREALAPPALGPGGLSESLVAGVHLAPSKEAVELLFAATEDPRGIVMRARSTDGTAIQVNQRNFTERGNARSEAIWEGALEELERLDLIHDLGHKREVFKVTRTGYELADKLQEGEERVRQ
jgi:hypothetical protein